MFYLWHRSLPPALFPNIHPKFNEPRQYLKRKKSAVSQDADGFIGGSIIEGCNDDTFSTSLCIDDDDMTDPTKSYLPYNIYHQDDFAFFNNDSPANIDLMGDITDPSMAYLPYNIFHDDLFPSDHHCGIDIDITFDDSFCSIGDTSIHHNDD